MKELSLEQFIYEPYEGGINLIDLKEDVKNEVTELVVPDEWNVTAISKFDFYGTDPFSGCEKLRRVVLPATLRTMNDAFSGCGSLSEVVFPESMPRLGNWNFRSCPSLEQISLPHSFCRVGFGNFEGSPVLLSEYGDEGDGCIYLGEYLFDCQSNDFGTVTVKDGTVLIADCTFANKWFTEVILPESLQYIGSEAFYCCDYLNPPALPAGLKSIGHRAFYRGKGDIIKGVHVTDGYFTAEGELVLEEELGYISAAALDAAAKRLDECLLKIDYENDSSYDSSDDDRVEDSSSSYSSTTYRRIDAKKDSKVLLRVDGEICGVVFTVQPKFNTDKKRRYAFLFDGRGSRSMTIGYSASHSSHYMTVKRVSLVKKGENGAPTEGSSVNFEPSEISTSI